MAIIFKVAQIGNRIFPEQRGPSFVSPLALAWQVHGLPSSTSASCSVPVTTVVRGGWLTQSCPQSPVQCGGSSLRGPGSWETSGGHPAFISFPASGPGGRGEDQTQGQMEDEPGTGDPRGYTVILAAVGTGPVVPAARQGWRWQPGSQASLLG